MLSLSLSANLHLNNLVITCQEPSQNLHRVSVCMYLSSMSRGKSDFVCKDPTQKLNHVKIWLNSWLIIDELHISLGWFRKHILQIYVGCSSTINFFLNHNQQKHILSIHPTYMKEQCKEALNVKVEMNFWMYLTQAFKGCLYWCNSWAMIIMLFIVFDSAS